MGVFHITNGLLTRIQKVCILNLYEIHNFVVYLI